jgi:arginase family enzyme
VATGTTAIEHADEVYVHIDLDAFDPDVAPGVVDDPCPAATGSRWICSRG